MLDLVETILSDTPASRLEENPKTWVREWLLVSPALELYQNSFDRLKNTAGADYAFIEILESAGGDLKEIGSHLIQFVNDTLLNIEKARKNNETCKMKAADLYRNFARPLRWLKSKDFHCKQVLQDLILEQTLPIDELDSPAWVDPYTGDVDLDYERPIRIEEKNLLPMSETLIDELGWTEKELNQFNTAQEGFNDDSEEVWYDEPSEPYEPMWMQIKQELQPIELNDLKEIGDPLIEDCRQTIKAIRDIMQKRLEDGIITQYEMPRKCREAFLESDAARDFIDWLSALAKKGSAPQDLALLFLQLQHGYAFTEKNAILVRLPEAPGFPSLYEFIQQHGNDLTSGDILPKSFEVSFEEIQAFTEKTIQDYANLGNPEGHPTETPAFIEGYLRAMVEAQSVMYFKDGKRRNAALEAGWENFRQTKSPFGNRAFHKAITEGKTPREAMAIFWKVTRREASNRIISINPKGLVLSSGRRINWKIAAIKLQEQELTLPQEERARLKNILIQKKWGLSFASSL